MKFVTVSTTTQAITGPRGTPRFSRPRTISTVPLTPAEGTAWSTNSFATLSR